MENLREHYGESKWNGLKEYVRSNCLHVQRLVDSGKSEAGKDMAFDQVIAAAVANLAAADKPVVFSISTAKNYYAELKAELSRMQDRLEHGLSHKVEKRGVGAGTQRR